MKTRIVCLVPGRIAPGMTLANDILTRDGHALLAAGSVLDAPMLEKLIRRGIETVSVLVLDTRSEQTIAIELAAVEARVNYIFRGEGSAARDTLRAAVLSFRQENVK